MSHAKSWSSLTLPSLTFFQTSWKRSFWCTWTVTRVSNFVRFVEEPRSARHMPTRSVSICTNFLFAEPMMVRSLSRDWRRRASWKSPVQTSWMPRSATCAMLLLPKSPTLRPFMSWPTSRDAMRHSLRTERCISASSARSQSSMLPMAMTGVTISTTSTALPTTPLIFMIFLRSTLSNCTRLMASKSFSKSSWMLSGSLPCDRIFSSTGSEVK
mmetsp:Transcript_2860/g.7981  ORF Transcript_2860/g.7981 Transcript_2860/m.7981 type:complete len:213 (+) Transcript_2860:668-1306(+)